MWYNMGEMEEGITRIKVYCESTERDNIEDVYKVRRSMSAIFETFEQFSEWLMLEQESAKKSGVKFIAAEQKVTAA